MPITVIIPAHNSTRYLAKTLLSLTNQERQPDEVLIVDDHSTDGTVEMAEAWAREQTFTVRVLSNSTPNAGKPGPAAGRMTGLREATSDMVALLDHDDEMLPCHLRLTEQALLQNPTLSLCFADAVEFSETDGREWNLFGGKAIRNLPFVEVPPDVRIITEPLLRSLIRGSYIPTAANLWRRDLARQVGGFHPFAGTCDDLLFFLCMSRVGQIAYYPIPIARKRLHSANLSDTKYALQSCWNYYEALRYFNSEAVRWNLSQGEMTLIGDRMSELSQEILYHASRKGVKAYVETKRRLGVANKRHFFVGVVRAMVRSTRLIFNPETS